MESVDIIQTESSVVYRNSNPTYRQNYGNKPDCNEDCSDVYVCVLLMALLIELADNHPPDMRQEYVLSEIILQDGTQICQIYP